MSRDQRVAVLVWQLMHLQQLTPPAASSSNGCNHVSDQSVAYLLLLLLPLLLLLVQGQCGSCWVSLKYGSSSTVVKLQLLFRVLCLTM
jgi:hypothetical protein